MKEDQMLKLYSDKMLIEEIELRGYTVIKTGQQGKIR